MNFKKQLVSPALLKSGSPAQISVYLTPAPLGWSHFWLVLSTTGPRLPRHLSANQFSVTWGPLGLPWWDRGWPISFAKYKVDNWVSETYFKGTKPGHPGEDYAHWKCYVSIMAINSSSKEKSFTFTTELETANATEVFKNYI